MNKQELLNEAYGILNSVRTQTAPAYAEKMIDKAKALIKLANSLDGITPTRVDPYG